MNSKELTLSMGLIMGRYICDSESMHYGLWPDDLEIKLDNLKQAQANFTDFIVANIPEGVKRILEVGSGSGELAQRLVGMGYAIDCVCPGDYLADKVQAKIGDAGTVHRCLFQELETDQKYDLVLFSESFHYIKLPVLFEKLPKLVAPGGAILLCNFFKREQRGGCAVGGGHLHQDYLSAVEASPFELEKDLDITKETARSIDLLGTAYTEVGAPCRDLIVRYLHSSHPFLTKVCGPFVRRFYGRKLRKLDRKLTPGKVTGANFAEFKTYRLNVLRHREAATG